MPFLQPSITRIGSGGTASLPGSNLYLTAATDPSGATYFYGDVFSRSTTDSNIYIELNTAQGAPQIAVVAPSTTTASLSLNTTDASGTLRSYFQIEESIDPVLGPTASLELVDRQAGPPGTQKGNIQFVSSINGSVGGVIINNEGNTSGIAVGQDITINTAANRYINVPSGTLSVSSLAVSSMVGAFIPYGVSTITANQDFTTIPINGAAWPLSKDIPVVAGNTYRLSALMGFSNNDALAVYNVIYVVGTGQPTIPIVAVVQTPTNPYLNTQTYSVIFNALTTGNVQVVAYNFSTTVPTILTFNQGPNPSSVPFWLVENLGPVGTIAPP